MTAETAKQILMILRGSYPADGWKLDADNAKLFEFVHRVFPDMDNATNIRNADVFREGQRSAMMMGTDKCKFSYQPETGLVDIVVIRK